MIHLLAVMTLLVITHVTCYAAMTERKYSAGKTALIYSLFCVVFVCLVSISVGFFGSTSGYMVACAYLSTIVVAFFVFMFTSADSACKKIFLFISYANVFSIFQCISMILCSVCFPNLSEIAALYAKNITRSVLYIPTIWFYIRFLRPTVRTISGRQKKTWYSISLVSLLFLAVFIIFITVCHANYGNVQKYIPLFAIVVLIYCSVLWIIFGTIRSMLNENKMELISQNMKYLQGQLESSKENELFAKTIRHDFRHHNQNIEIMLKKGEIQEALHYLQQYNESLDTAKPREFCPNVTVNAILNSFYTKALNEGIFVSVAADTGENTAISDMDFVAILSNLLENAINGYKEYHSGGEIKVNLRTVADKTVIVCSNPCNPNLAIENNMIKHRGTGIDSMVSAARKYDGDISYRLENDVLTVCIILKN